VRIGGTIKPPTKLTNVNPTYPVEAQRNRIQGVVILELMLGTDGGVESVKVVRSVPELDAAAVDAVKQWTYTPTLVNDIAQRVVLTVTVSFNLQSSFNVQSVGGGGRGASSGVTGSRVVRVGAGVPAPQRIKGSDPKYPGAANSQRALKGLSCSSSRSCPMDVS
jgi:TonB family protein